jgi:hypothetical protein
MKQIPLTQGKFALVDDEDFEELSKYKWCAYRHRNTFYASRSVRINGKNKNIRMHRQVLSLVKKNEYCDHINGDGLNNQKSNLRICGNAENLLNRGKGKNNTSEFKGVTRDNRDGVWYAQIKVNKKHFYLGRFKNKKDAAIAYNEAAKLHHGEFARLNKID